MPIFFVPFLLNNKKAIKPKALLTWPIHSYITNKDKLKSVLSIYISGQLKFCICLILAELLHFKLKS